jgi:hypothetical protein
MVDVRLSISPDVIFGMARTHQVIHPACLGRHSEKRPDKRLSRQ